MPPCTNRARENRAREEEDRKWAWVLEETSASPVESVDCAAYRGSPRSSGSDSSSGSDLPELVTSHLEDEPPFATWAHSRPGMQEPEDNKECVDLDVKLWHALGAGTQPQGELLDSPFSDPTMTDALKECGTRDLPPMGTSPALALAPLEEDADLNTAQAAQKPLVIKEPTAEELAMHIVKEETAIVTLRSMCVRAAYPLLPICARPQREAHKRPPNALMLASSRTSACDRAYFMSGLATQPSCIRRVCCALPPPAQLLGRPKGRRESLPG